MTVRGPGFSFVLWEQEREGRAGDRYCRLCEVQIAYGHGGTTWKWITNSATSSGPLQGGYEYGVHCVRMCHSRD